MTSKKLYLFLDIDNVLNASCAFYSRSRAWPDFKYVDQFRKREIVSPMMIEELNDFIEEFTPEVYMVSTWEERSKDFCRLIGLEGAENWPWLNSTVDLEGKWAKFHSVLNISTTNGETAPAIWIDDDLADEHEAALWAAWSGVLAIAPSENHGITPAHLAQMRAYAENLRNLSETPKPEPKYIDYFANRDRLS
jgi:hypothetical protein